MWWVKGGRERLTLQLAVFDGDEAGGRDARAVEERGVLEGAGLFDANVEVVFGVGDEDPLLLLFLFVCLLFSFAFAGPSKNLV